jgi:hypothetical protein
VPVRLVGARCEPALPVNESTQMGDHWCYNFNHGVSNNRQRLLEEWERHIFF